MTSESMCRKTRFGRARHGFRKLLNGLGLCHGRRSGDADPGLKAVDGSDPPIRHASYGIGGGWDVHFHPNPRLGSLPVHQSRAGRPNRHAWTRPPRPWPRPSEHRGLGRRAGDPPPRSGARHPSGTDRWCWSDPKGTAAGVRKHTRPRTRTRPSDWGVAPVTACAARAARAGMAAPAQDGAAPADKREVQCASPDGQSAHRLPVSFARFSTALSRSVDNPPTQLRRPARLPRPCRRAVPTTRSAARSASTTERDFVAARMTAARPESQRPVGQSVRRPTSNTTAWVAIKFHRAAAVHEEPDVRRDRCSGWCGEGLLTSSDLGSVVRGKAHGRKQRQPRVPVADLRCHRSRSIRLFRHSRMT